MLHHRLGVAATIALVAALAPSAGCSLWSDVKQTASQDINCIKEAEKEAASGKDPVQIAESIAEALGTAAATAAMSGGDIAAALEAALPALYAQYGEPAVACVFHRAAPSAAAKASGDPVYLAIDSILVKHAWHFVAPAAK